MRGDPIVEEIRAFRDAFAKEHGYDVKAIVAALQRAELESHAEVVTLPAKRLPVDERDRIGHSAAAPR